jgi:23S rRNA (uridine2552-2'-O)-methyltransferase
LDGPFDLVISDMAPKTSGQRHADQYRSYQLVMRALELAKTVLKPGGTFVAKIFQGAEFDDARKALRESFDKVRTMRPEATRDESYEVFLVGIDFKPASS